jgi:hypothetical protein
VPDTLPGLVSINHNLIGLARQHRRPGRPAPAGRASPRRVRPGLPREGQYPKGRHGAPGLIAAPDCLRPGDTLVVWKLDRLGRSVKEVLTVADDLHARGIAVRILTVKLAGSYSPAGEGKFFVTMMAASPSWSATSSASAPWLASLRRRLRAAPAAVPP